MARKLRVYLENSLIGMYFQDEVPHLKEMTREFWRDVLPAFDAFVSQVVLGEISATKQDELRDAMDKLVGGFEVLSTTREAVELADVYLSRRRMPRADALHLAVASLCEMDYLVTCNLRHLYRRGTQEMIQEVNSRLRILTPAVATPEDFLAEEGRYA